MFKIYNPLVFVVTILLFVHQHWNLRYFLKAYEWCGYNEETLSALRRSPDMFTVTNAQHEQRALLDHRDQMYVSEALAFVQDSRTCTREEFDQRLQRLKKTKEDLTHDKEEFDLITKVLACHIKMTKWKL